MRSLQHKQSVHERLLYVVAAFAIIAGLFFYNPFGLYFLGDDFIHIPASKTSLLSQRSTFRPIGNISLYLDQLMSGTSPVGYHSTNLVLHIINTGLLLWFVRLLQKKFTLSASPVVSLLVASLFFIYPFHSEAVFWVIGRSASLGSLFFLLAANFLLWFNGVWLRLVISLLFFELALLAYESTWIFPMFVIVFLFGLKKPWSKAYVAYCIGSWVLLLVHIIWRFAITGQVVHTYEAKALIQGDVLAIAANCFRLFGRSFLPPFVNSTLFMVMTSFMLLAMLAVTAFALRSQHRTIFVFILSMWLLSYLPYLSLGIDTHGVEGERFLYLPSIFLCVFLGIALRTLERPKATLIVYSVLVAYGTYFLNASRGYYTKGSDIARTTMEQVKQVQTYSHLHFLNLPQYNKGAVVFRLGLAEGIQWLVPDFKGSIHIQSIDDSDVRVSPSFHRQWTVIDSVSARPSESTFTFTDTSLTIYK